MSSSNSKKTALITGCSSGIGAALAKEFLTQGFHVIATARRPEVLSDLAALGATTIALDVASDESVEHAKDEVVALTGGKIDILVNNAGMSEGHSPAADLDLANVQAMFNTNVFGAMRMVKAFVPLLVASGGDARIANLGSVSGVIPYPFACVYASTKAALHSYNDTIRVELAPLGIKVINLCTGGVQSNITRQAPPRPLPETSFYKPLEEHILKIRRSTVESEALPAAEYARLVVREITKPKPRPWFWAGSSSLKVWFVSTFLPRWFMDVTWTKRFNLVALVASTATQKKIA
ncbi:hypothetical protein EV715DRAFT_271115 [Schizophyllum commune]